MGRAIKQDKATGDTAARVRKHRARMRAAGLKPVTIWVPDINTPAMREEIRRQCLSLRDDPAERQILQELEGAAAEIPGWTWDGDTDETR